MLEDGGVRTARDVAAILAVPVRQQHDDNPEAVELPRADKRVVVPRPAMLVEEHAHRSILELEPRIGEAAVLAHLSSRARERRHAVDAAAGDVMRDLREVAAGGGETDAERFGLRLVTPL